MNLLHRTFGLSLLCAGLLGAASSHAEPGTAVPEAKSGAPDARLATGFTSKEDLSSLFDVEGNDPFSSPYVGTLTFSAFNSKFDSGHGHGYRNEVKIAEKLRRSVELTHEHFSAHVTPTLPNGAKTIVAQYHVDGLDTILKVYVQDTADNKLIDGKAGNGIFDVLVRIRTTTGKEVTTALGTVRSGEGFDLDINFANGDAIVAVKTASSGVIRTDRTRISGEKRNIYFKFGDYLQALDPATLALTTTPSKWDEYYLLNHIDSSQVRFSHVVFERD